MNAVTKNAEVEPFSLGRLLFAALGSRVVGPYPLVVRYEGKIDLTRRLGVGTQVVISKEVTLGRMVVVRRDEF